MIQYFIGFLISGVSGYALAAALLAVYERNRAYGGVQLEEHAKWHIRRAIKKTSIGAGLIAGGVWALASRIF